MHNHSSRRPSHELGASPLISTDQCLEFTHDPTVKIFDVRGKWGSPAAEALEDYQKGHIPGAILLNWKTHFLEPYKPTNLASVASQSQATESFQALGISKDDLVVLYDDYHHMLAGRIWWAMRYWGFTNVKVLNGGWQNWCNKGLPHASTHEVPSAGNFLAVEQPHLRVSLPTLVKTKDNNNLIDARGINGYTGNLEDPRSGHIPGAISIPFREVLDGETGCFKEDAILRTLFNKRLPNFKSSPIISSCGSGYAGTIILLALYQLGIEAPLFDGSFSVWKMDEDLPVERGLTNVTNAQTIEETMVKEIMTP